MTVHAKFVSTGRSCIFLLLLKSHDKLITHLFSLNRTVHVTSSVQHMLLCVCHYWYQVFGCVWFSYVCNYRCLLCYWKENKNYRNHGELWLVLQNRVTEFNVRLNSSSTSAMRIQKLANFTSLISIIFPDGRSVVYQNKSGKLTTVK